MDWEIDDDPWVEHARWSPLCSYVLLSKGKRFVEEVGGEVNYSLQMNMEVSIFKLILKILLKICIALFLQELNKLFTIHRHLAVDSDTMRFVPMYNLWFSQKLMYQLCRPRYQNKLKVYLNIYLISL